MNLAVNSMVAAYQTQLLLGILGYVPEIDFVVRKGMVCSLQVFADTDVDVTNLSLVHLPNTPFLQRILQLSRR
jgi:hypothetical protein